MGKIIGIDLGTSNTAAAVLEGGKPTIIPSAEGTSVGGKAFPSYVAFTKDAQLLVGEPARRQAVANPDGTVTAFKRRMGEDFQYGLQSKKYAPQQLSAFLLQKVKRDAEAFLGEPVDKAVITVPAYFNDNQRQATKDAGQIAGLEVVRIVNEPTAACLAYGIDKKGKDEKIMVFDLGGGTLDVTIMEFGGGVFEVQSTSGDTKLGGTDMDNALTDFVCSEFRRDTGIDISKDSTAMQRVREAVEKAKIELSSVFETDLNLPFISADNNSPKHLVLKLTRAKLESLVDPIVGRCKQSVDTALADAKLKTSDISRIILVGGPTRMPIVQKFVEDYVGKKVERGVDPMECVASGAAVQAAVLTGEVKDVLLLDVTPLTLGIETLGGVTTALIERNTTIPVEKSQVFSTASDNQPAVTVHVLQGERPMAKDNVSLGKFDLDGIPPAPRGVPQIKVTFSLDANGILSVRADDLGTKKTQHITITAKNKLSKEEVERFVEQAEQFADEDKKNQGKVEAKNEADTLLYSTEKAVREHGGKLSQEERQGIDRGIADLKDAQGRESASSRPGRPYAGAQKLGRLSTRRLPKSASGEGRREGRGTRRPRRQRQVLRQGQRRGRRGRRRERSTDRILIKFQWNDESRDHDGKRLLRAARRPAQRHGGGDQIRLPQTRAQAPPGPQPGQQGRRGQVQAGQLGLRGPLGPGQAPALRPVRGSRGGPRRPGGKAGRLRGLRGRGVRRRLRRPLRELLRGGRGRRRPRALAPRTRPQVLHLRHPGGGLRGRSAAHRVRAGGSLFRLLGPGRQARHRAKALRAMPGQRPRAVLPRLLHHDPGLLGLRRSRADHRDALRRLPGGRFRAQAPPPDPAHPPGSLRGATLRISGRGDRRRAPDTSSSRYA